MNLVELIGLLKSTPQDGGIGINGMLKMGGNETYAAVDKLGEVFLYHKMPRMMYDDHTGREEWIANVRDGNRGKCLAFVGVIGEREDFRDLVIKVD